MWLSVFCDRLSNAALIVPVGCKNTRFTRRPAGTRQQQSTGGTARVNQFLERWHSALSRLNFHVLSPGDVNNNRHTKVGVRPFKTINKSWPARSQWPRPCENAKLTVLRRQNNATEGENLKPAAVAAANFIKNTQRERRFCGAWRIQHSRSRPGIILFNWIAAVRDN